MKDSMKDISVYVTMSQVTLYPACNRRFISQARRTRYFARSAPRSPHLAYKVTCYAGYKICICSVTPWPELESFRNYKGFSINYASVNSNGAHSPPATVGHLPVLSCQFRMWGICKFCASLSKK